MTKPLDPAELSAQALKGGGAVPLATLLVSLVPVAALREVAARFGVAPKGFRVERASAPALAKLLTTSDDVEQLDAVCAALVAHLGGAAKKQHKPPATERVEQHERALAHKQAEIDRLQREVERARTTAARHREREAELQRDLDHERATGARRRAELQALRESAAPNPNNSGDDDVHHRLHEALRDLGTLEEAEQDQRRRAAAQAARIRTLEQEVEKLHAALPKGRRKKEPPPPPPPVPDTFRLPVLAPSFYKSLEGKDRRAIAQAVHAVLLFCVEGPSYPGLEVKRLEASALWSLRAARKLRVLFKLHDQGTAEFVELVDREEQYTTLRRRRDRPG